MSLLLEALKKAEKAKEDAQRAAQSAEPAPPAPSAFDPEATVVDPNRQVTTRDQLPDISSSLQIESDDLRPAAAAKAPLELAIAEDAPAPSAPKSAARGAPSRAASGSNVAENAERATAQRVFEAKFKEPNPRLPFMITMGVLGAFAVGTVIYFWMQLRPPPPLINTNPQRAADERPVTPVPQAAGVLPAGTAAPSTGPAVIPGLPGAAPAQPAAPAPGPVATSGATAPVPAAPAASVPSAALSPAPAPAKPAAAATPRERPARSAEARSVTVTRGAPQIHPQVASGYAAYQAGDLPKARADYQQVLREEPANRDALLGLAAVEMRAQAFDLSDAYYRRVLQSDPRDPHAQAGAIALRSQQLDPVQAESRVKSLLAADRDATVLYFTLGNQYAQQGRWADAQQAYFKAFAADPDNPDFAFNLAVSLDQLHQPRLALEHYRRALALAEKRTPAFAPETARTRVQQLSR
jgi:Tfp pilus assembly protein PilF